MYVCGASLSPGGKTQKYSGLPTSGALGLLVEHFAAN
jgi:hypothetical protein